MTLQGKVTASAVGSIVGMQSEQIQQAASEYAKKVRASDYMIYTYVLTV